MVGSVNNTNYTRNVDYSALSSAPPSRPAPQIPQVPVPAAFQMAGNDRVRHNVRVLPVSGNSSANVGELELLKSRIRNHSSLSPVIKQLLLDILIITRLHDASYASEAKDLGKYEVLSRICAAHRDAYASLARFYDAHPDKSELVPILRQLSENYDEQFCNYRKMLCHIGYADHEEMPVTKRELTRLVVEQGPLDESLRAASRQDPDFDRNLLDSRRGSFCKLYMQQIQFIAFRAVDMDKMLDRIAEKYPRFLEDTSSFSPGDQIPIDPAVTLDLMRRSVGLSSVNMQIDHARAVCNHGVVRSYLPLELRGESGSGNA